jgi:hypothetical protein
MCIRGARDLSLDDTQTDLMVGKTSLCSILNEVKDLFFF